MKIERKKNDIRVLSKSLRNEAVSLESTPKYDTFIRSKTIKKFPADLFIDNIMFTYKFIKHTI